MIVPKYTLEELVQYYSLVCLQNDESDILSIFYNKLITIQDHFNFSSKYMIYAILSQLNGLFTYSLLYKYLPYIHLEYLCTIINKHVNDKFLNVEIKKLDEKINKSSLQECFSNDIIIKILYSQDISENIICNESEYPIISNIDEIQPDWKKNLLIFSIWIIYINEYKSENLGILDFHYCCDTSGNCYNDNYALFELCDIFEKKLIFE